MATDPSALVHRLLDLQAQIRTALRSAQQRHDERELSAVARVGVDDTIFKIDVHAEEMLLRACEQWGKTEPLRLIAEGLDPAGMTFGTGEPRWRLIVDPIDGTRPLMFDKRSAWSLAALAPERGNDTRLRDCVVATMTELPPSWQSASTRLWAIRGQGAHGERVEADGSTRPVRLRPSTSTTLRYGFAASCNFFLGAKELIARVEEAIFTRHLNVAEPWRTELYVDLYMSSGAQLAELAFGRDRFALDIRPLAHRALHQPRALCSHPYDLCTALIPLELGCIITDLDHAPFDAPMSNLGDVGWIGYANEALRQALQPIVRDELARLRVN